MFGYVIFRHSSRALALDFENDFSLASSVLSVASSPHLSLHFPRIKIVNIAIAILSKCDMWERIY